MLQKEDVEEVRLVDWEELLELQMNDRLRDDDYMKMIENAVCKLLHCDR